MKAPKESTNPGQTEFKIDPSPNFGCEPLAEVKKNTRTKTRDPNRLLNFKPDAIYMKRGSGKPSVA